jgi:periplasmic divalent cation tolerance protein
MQYAHIVVYITVPSQEVGQQIAAALLDDRLVACVNMLPEITSIYHWQGTVSQDSELLLIAKTRADLFDRLQDAVKQLHPYQVPEVVAMPIVMGSSEYLAWIDAETS